MDYTSIMFLSKFVDGQWAGGGDAIANIYHSDTNDVMCNSARALASLPKKTSSAYLSWTLSHVNALHLIGSSAVPHHITYPWPTHVR